MSNLYTQYCQKLSTQHCQKLYIVNLLITYSQYLHQPASVDEVKYIHESLDFLYFRHVLWRMCIIDLSKLYSYNPQSNHFNLHSLLKKVKSGGVYNLLYSNEPRVVSWEKSIESHETAISRVNTLRNKVYAHTDRDFGSIKSGTLDLSFAEIQPLIDLAEEILVVLFSEVFGAHLDTENVYFDRERFNMIKILAQHEKDEMDDF